MRKILFTFFACCFALANAQTPCINGFAGVYPCEGFDLMSNIPVSVLANTQGSPAGSDIWGWTDPLTNKEYAICGMTNSTAFVDVTDPVNPVFLGRLDTSAGTNYWRDVKVYNNYAFIVADGVGNHGMQVFDLRRLRGVLSPPVSFVANAVYSGVGSCHNIVINEDKGIAYLVGCRSTNGGGPIFVDISDPLAAKFSGQYTAGGYSHDAQVITYKGSDSPYVGKEIYVASNENELLILDVTDKANPKRIGSVDYPQIGYTHQGWFTDDHRYFIVGDETDETDYGMNTRTLVFDLQDLDNPILSSTYYSDNKAIDHNGYVKGDEFYLASYRAGLRLLDITSIGAASDAMKEIGYFDTFPQSNSANFNGCWSVYPYFKSGNIILNDIERGLFVIRKSASLSVEDLAVEEERFTISPNPVVKEAKLISENAIIESVVIYAVSGEQLFEQRNLNVTSIDLPLAQYQSGVYLVKINDKLVKKVIVK